MNDIEQRITLIAHEAAKQSVDWNYSRLANQRVAFLDSVSVLRFALSSAVREVGLDVERVIIDRTGDAGDFLDLISRTPSQFMGDLIFIRDDGSGFLSAAGRGDGRVLYSLGAEDVRFYLETHDLVTGRDGELRMTA